MMKFSVLLSVYYKENPDFLKQSLDSILNQSRLPDELVLVKDGQLSIDLDRMIDSYVRKYTGLFKILALSENQGLGKALDVGLKYCTFDVVARMDTDDIATPNRFERQITVFEKYPELDVVGAWISEFENVSSNVVSIRKLPEYHNEIYLYAKKRGYTSSKRYLIKEKTKIILEALPCLLMIIIVIGGIIGGIFTATEGAIVAVVYSLILSLVFYKSIKVNELPKLLMDSAEMTGIIIFLIGVSSIMSWVMAFTGIPAAISGVMLSISSNKYVILLIINVILLIVGTFMDMTPACLIFTPIFLPICQAVGMNTIHFGIMMIFNLCIGTITPPVGTTLFVGVKVGKTKIEDVIKPLLYYFAAIFIVLLLVTYIPAISLWLPGLLGYVK